jgi:hypothetical protein
MPTVEVWIAMSEKGECGVGTDEDSAIESLLEGSADDSAETVCRVVKLNVTLALPHEADEDDDDDEADGPAVDVVVPDGAGRIVEVETE